MRDQEHAVNHVPGYSIELDLRQRSVLVVGLGVVGARKAEGLLQAGGRVVGIDPRSRLSVPAGVEHRVEAFRPAHLNGMSLVFAAATTEVNRQVVRLAKARGIWVNAASEPDSGDFFVPAVWRDGPIILTVSTSGTSPSLARELRNRAATSLHGLSDFAELLGKFRLRAKQEIRDDETRRRLLMDWADPKWLERRIVEGAAAIAACWDEQVRAASELPESSDMS